MHHIDTLTLKPAPDAEPASGDGRGVSPSLGRGGPRPTDPPLVIRGIVVENPSMWGHWEHVNVGFGWFSFTCPDQYTNQLVDQWTHGFQAPPDTASGVLNYEHSHRWRDQDRNTYASISYGGTSVNQTALCAITGLVADTWTVPLGLRIIRETLAIPDTFNVKRLDTRIDVRGTDLGIVQAISGLEGLQWPRTRIAHTVNPRNALAGTHARSKGHTAYLGIRESPSMVRTYDKGQKSKMGPNLHHRIEAQFQGPKAATTLDAILEHHDPDQASYAIRALTLGALDYRLDDGTLPEAFAQLLRNLNTVPLKLNPVSEIPSAQRFLDAADRQFLGRIKAACILADLDPAIVGGKLIEAATCTDRTIAERKTAELADLLSYGIR